jgi:hypothetical protein
MDLNGDIIFDSLPYCDDDLDLESADFLVQKQVQKMYNKPTKESIDLFTDKPFLAEYLEQVKNKIKTNSIDISRFRMESIDENNAKSQLEYQANKFMNLELSSKFGANSWIINNYELEKLTEMVKNEITLIDDEILAINQQRKQDQVIYY